MKVKTTYLFYPIVILIVVVVATTFALQRFNVEQASLGYDYQNKLFQPDQLQLIELTVAEEKWNEILANPTAEQYVEASVTLNGETYDHVGVRAKGNSSLSSVATSDSDRYSLKIDFSQYNSSQTYYGLEKINLNNGFSDSTMIKEYVSYTLMKQFNIATPAFSFAKVMLNGEYYGLMLAVEEIGEAFIRTNYNTSEGYLFKPENTGSTLKYISDNIEDYSGILNEVKYNEDEVKVNSNIVKMIEEINNNDYSSVNVEEVAKYFALNTALVNLDSYQGNFAHNYYLYEDANGQFSVIPWDYNMSFGGFNMGGGGGGNRMNREQADTNVQNNRTGDHANAKKNMNNNPFNQGDRNGENNRGQANLMNFGSSSSLLSDSTINYSIYNPVSGTSISERPLLAVILQNEETKVLYETYLEEITATLLTEENMKAITEPLEALLFDAVDEDQTKFTTTEQFLESIKGENSFTAFAKLRSAAILEQLNDPDATVDTTTSSNTENTSAEGGQGRPNFEGGEMPNFGEGQAPPNFEGGEMPNFEGGQGRPNFEGGEMPNFGQNRGDNNITTTTQLSSKQVLWIMLSCIIALIFALIVITFISKLKYRRRR